MSQNLGKLQPNYIQFKYWDTLKLLISHLGQMEKSMFLKCPILKHFRVVRSFGSKDYIKGMKIANSVLLKSRKENPQKLTQLSSRSHPRHLVGKRTAQKDTTIATISDSQVNSNFPYRWSPACLTFNNYFYLLLYLYIT